MSLKCSTLHIDAIMGRSAKFHKRTVSRHPPCSKRELTESSQQKQKKSTSAPTATALQVSGKASATQSAVQEQKKRANLKAKAIKPRKDAQGPVLGGADYVELMLGSRRKAMEEAAKLPQDEE